MKFSDLLCSMRLKSWHRHIILNTHCSSNSTFLFSINYTFSIDSTADFPPVSARPTRCCEAAPQSHACRLSHLVKLECHAADFSSVQQKCKGTDCARQRKDTCQSFTLGTETPEVKHSLRRHEQIKGTII